MPTQLADQVELKSKTSTEIEEKDSLADYLLVTFSLTSLVFNNVLGALAIIGFLAPWMVIMARKSSTAISAFRQYWPLFLLPLLDLASAIWSHDKMASIKSALELVPTIMIGLAAATCVQMRPLIAATLTSLATAIGLSVVTMWGQLTSAEETSSLTGVFGSKNAFAYNVCLLMLTSYPALIDKKQRIYFRLCGLFSILFGPILLYFAHSLGAVLSIIITFSLYFFGSALRKLPTPLRILLILFVAGTGSLILIAYLAGAFDSKTILALMGKSATLTGRTLLWQVALDSFDSNPLFGVGYQGFWILSNPKAQILWDYFDVTPGPGFNFHNEYMEALVEIGLIGLTLEVFFLARVTLNTFNLAAKEKSFGQIFTFLIFVFHLIRTPTEVAIFYQFCTGMIFFCMSWVMLKPNPAIDRTTRRATSRYRRRITRQEGRRAST